MRALPRWRMLALGASLAAAGACNGDSMEPARASTLAAASPVQQTAPAGAMVADAPSVRVTDQNGQPMPNVAVTFQVTGGGGTITGGAATTNASGVASAAAWTLGSTPGANTVSASVAGLTPVVFTATAVDPCDVRTSLALGATVSGALSARDCQFQTGEYADYLEVNLATAQAVSFRMASSGVDAYLLLYAANGTTLAFNDDDADELTSDARLNVFAPSGIYELAATSYDPQEAGAYQVSASTFSGNEACGEYWVVPGVQITGTIEATDCDSGTFSDQYVVALRAGETLRVEMESGAIDAFLSLYDVAGNVAAWDDDGAGGTDALVTYTASGLEVLYIDAGTFTPGETGTYALSVTSTGASAAAAALELRRPETPTRGQRRQPARVKPAGR